MLRNVDRAMTNFLRAQGAHDHRMRRGEISSNQDFQKDRLHFPYPMFLAVATQDSDLKQQNAERI